MIIQPDDLLPALMKQRKSGKTRKGLSTGFESVDEFMLLNKKYLMLITGYPSYGKALAIDTPIPTPNGFITMGELKTGDQVFDENGQICNVTGCTDVMYDRECFEITLSDGQRVTCDADHLWFTRTEQSRMSAQHAMQNKRDKERPLKLRGVDQTHKRTFDSTKTTREIAATLQAYGRNNHHIPITKPVEYPEQNLIIQPYTLGAWLGDGRTNYASITCFDDDILGHIESDGYTVRAQAQKGAFGIINGFVGKLKQYSLLGNKHIPEVYMRSSIAQRTALLQGLMDTDGHCTKYSSCEFVTNKETLALQVKELVASLGLRPCIYTGQAMLNGKLCGTKYRVQFHPRDVIVFRLHRKQSRCLPTKRCTTRAIVACQPVPSVPVKCISVDSKSHLYLCTRSYVPTHNSEYLDALAVNSAILHDWKWLYFSPESDDFSTNLRKLITKKMGKPLVHATESEIQDATHWANEHFAWIDSGDAVYSMDDVMRETQERIECGHQVDVMVIDPWNELSHAKQSGRDDVYISDMMLKLRKFHRKYNTLSVIVIHPHAVEKNKDGTYPIPHLRNCAGGAMWWNKADYGVCVHRKDFSINGAHVYIQKVKDTTIGFQGQTFLDYEVSSGRFKDQFSPRFDLPEAPDAPPF